MHEAWVWLGAGGQEMFILLLQVCFDLWSFLLMLVQSCLTVASETVSLLHKLILIWFTVILCHNLPCAGIIGKSQSVPQRVLILIPITWEGESTWPSRRGSKEHTHCFMSFHVIYIYRLLGKQEPDNNTTHVHSAVTFTGVIANLTTD